METTARDHALRQALAPLGKEGEPPRLPSNFAFTTLQRIRREQRQAERRQQRLAVAFVAGVALLGLVAIVIFCGATLRQLFLGVVHQPQSLALALPTLFCLTFFALLNHWLAKHY